MQYATGRAAADHKTQLDPGIPGALAHSRGGQWAFIGFTGYRRRPLYRRRLDCGRRNHRHFDAGLWRDLWRCGLCGLDLWLSAFTQVARAFDFDADQFAAHRHHFAGLAAQGQDSAGNGGGNVDGGLVGHDVGHHLIFADHVADFDKPFNQFNLCNAFANVRHLVNVRTHLNLHDPLQSRTHPGRAGEVGPLLGMGIRRIPAGNALDWRFQVVEAVLLNQCDQLGAKSAGAGGFVHDNATAGLLYRGDDGVQVQRPEAAQVDDFRIDAGFFGGHLGDIHGVP